jgi:hypothetical protein
LATIGAQDHIIIEFKTAYSGRNVSSWRPLDDAPA